MYMKKILANSTRRSFQLPIGLKAGYEGNEVYTPVQVREMIGDWIRGRMEKNLPCITGGTVIPASMVYAWNSTSTGIAINHEETVLFVGEVSPLYSGDLTDSEVVTILEDLASFVGEHLKQTRMYILYCDEVHILQHESTPHPTES